jgi:hypothetical protein
MEALGHGEQTENTIHRLRVVDNFQADIFSTWYSIQHLCGDVDNN